jgi:tetratricopeptide (TPR) repeat protein
MPAERNETETELPAIALDSSIDTGPMTAAPDPVADETRLMIGMHLSIAARLLREGSPSRAFSELVRATRESPLTGRLASSLARVALLAGTASAAHTLISDQLSDADEEERPGILRALARLHRRGDDLEKAREQLVVLLAEQPGDRRARFVLNALLEQEERWDELDASLERETRENHRRGALKSASRTALRRARLWGERLNDPARAALRYGQAAQYAAQAGDLESAFLLRLLWLRALHQSQAPKKAVEEAIDLALDAGDAVGRTDAVEALVADLGLRAPAAPALAPASPAKLTPSGGNAPIRRASTQIELMAVAEAVQAQGKPEVAALLAAAVQEGPEPRALKKLEAHYVARGAWRELAQLYRQSASNAASRAEKVETLEKLAELLESELHDPVGAAKVYSDLVALGDGRAVAEQVRLLNLQKDSKGVRAALDDSVSRAGDPKLRADALVMRADDALARRDVDAARRDFEESLKLAPFHPAAAAGLAELSAQDGRREPMMTFAAALKNLPRRKPGRAELYRRLGRLADTPFHEPKLAREAWSELLAELPGDEEALVRLVELSRELGDDVQLEQVLKTQLEREPRGLRARKAHLELVALLEKAGRKDEALEALKAAVRFEPGNRDAWLALSDRYLQLDQIEETMWALEHGATATESGVERMRLWLRLARLARDRLKDPAKADAFEARADKLKRELAAELPEGPLAGRLNVPPRVAPKSSRPSPPRSNPWDDVAKGLGAQREPEFVRPPRPSLGRQRAEPLSSNPESREGGGQAGSGQRIARVGDTGLQPAGLHERIVLPEGAAGAAREKPMMPEAEFARGAARALEANPDSGKHSRLAPPDPSLGRARVPSDPGRPRVASDPGRAAVGGAAAEPSGRYGAVVRPPVQPLGDDGTSPSGKTPKVTLQDRVPLANDDDEVSVEEALRGEDDVVEVGTADIELPSAEWVAPVANLEDDPDDDDSPRKTAEVPLEGAVALGDPGNSIPPSIVMSASRVLGEERKAIFERVRAQPLDPDGYRLLAEHFDHSGDPTRSSLMLEIARALEGDPNAAPRAPKLILSATDRAGLKHPALRGPSGELLGLSGAALCRLYPARGVQREELRLDSGKGAKAAADALLAAVRILGLRAPDVFLSEDNGPPFSLIHTTEPKLLVGKLAVRKQLPDAELRFFAGRALFTQNPDLLALRSLRKEQLAHGLQVLGIALNGRGINVESRVVRDAIPQRTLERLKELYGKHASRLEVQKLQEGARHSANRAGLVVCGGVAPALAALRAKKALESELLELVRYAASERYLELRSRRLA